MSVPAACPKCQATYTFKDEFRGKKVRCKKCAAVFVAGAPKRTQEDLEEDKAAPRSEAKSRPADVPVRKSTRRAQNHGADAVDEEGPVPRRAKGKSNAKVLLVVGGAAGGLSLLLGTGIVLLMWQPAQTTPRLAYTRTTGTNSPPAGTEAPRESNKPPKVFALTAKEFHDEFEKDPLAAGKKYANSVVELTGVVTVVGDVGGGQSHIHIGSERNKYNDCVICMTGESEPWSRLSPGQRVKFRGKCLGGSWVGLIDCEVLEADPNPAVAISALQLAGEFTSGKDATNEKYLYKYLILTGEVLDKSADVGGATVTLSGNGKVKISCRFIAHNGKQAEKLQVGQKIKLSGHYDSGFENEIFVVGCLIITRAGQK